MILKLSIWGFNLFCDTNCENLLKYQFKNSVAFTVSKSSASTYGLNDCIVYKTCMFFC